MQNSILINRGAGALACVLLLASGMALMGNEREVVERSGRDYAAQQLLRRGQALLEAGDTERGIRMLETVIEQNPTHDLRFQAHLDLGRHYVAVRDQTKAVESLGSLYAIKSSRRDADGKVAELTGKDLDIYLEGVYLTGVAYFHARRYSGAFASFRELTSNYPNSVWANQAYYYIGMSHYAQENWSKAIENLGLVGTFIDPDSPAVEYVEAGHRFYVKILDKDLSVLNMLNQEVTVSLQSASGDHETLVCTPQRNDTTIYVGSILTSLGTATPENGILEVIGGDTITVTYIDDSDKQGQKNVKRTKVVKVVSTGTLAFMRGTYEGNADAAFLGQPVFVRVRDVDLDISPAADTVDVRISSLYMPEAESEVESDATPAAGFSLGEFLQEKGAELSVRDEVVLTLTEVGQAPVHTGEFIGSLMVISDEEGQTPNLTDNQKSLSARVGDVIVARYVDAITGQGHTEVEVTAQLPVFDEIDSSPRADQDVVSEAVLRAQKETVEAEAYLEIARIFQSMGLKRGAKTRSDQGLERVDFAIRSSAAIPPSLRERAFQIKWNLYLAQDNFNAAMATCRSFSALFPGSPLVDNALMGIAKIHLNRQEYDEAIRILSQMSNMPGSRLNAEAAFMVAQTQERRDAARGASAGISAYMSCARRFPNSEFAGPSLAKVLDYQISTRNFAEADNLLSQIFLDYQDEAFLDTMLMKWVDVAVAMGNYHKASEKANQLLFEYPGSVHASKVTEQLAKIENALGKQDNNADGVE